MKESFVLFFCSVFTLNKALECGIGGTNTDELRHTISQCVKDNQTLESILELAVSSSSESSSSQDENPHTDSKLARLERIKRSRTLSRLESDQHQQQQNNENGQNDGNNSNEADDDQISTEKSVKHIYDDSEGCIVQCILENMGMTDDNGYPEHTKFVGGLIRTGYGRELRDFLQDSTDECFQQMDQEDHSDACIYSSHMVACLAEKGRENCSDWPIGNLPFH